MLFALLIVADAKSNKVKEPKLKPIKIKSIAHYSLKIPEPSDICYSETTHSYFIVSDQGRLFETDEKGTIIRQAPYHTMDYEGVYEKDGSVYVSEEMTRNVLVYDAKSLERSGSYQLHNHGARNKGFEALTYNPIRKRFIACTEADPVKLYEYDEKFIQLNDIPLKGISDASAATYYDNHIYVLSDESRTILVFNAADMKLEKKYSINILNPEGICFGPAGELKIVSDDMQTLYDFGKLTQ
jgi:uncharacterized protein YjiK